MTDPICPIVDTEELRHSPLPLLLDAVQKAHGSYFWDGAHDQTGLPYDRKHKENAAVADLVSIGGIGFGIMVLVVLVHRKLISRKDACLRLLKIVQSLEQISRFRGAFPHFVRPSHLKIVRWKPRDDGGDLVETSLLVQGLICAREFFSGLSAEESDLRGRINMICDAVEWANYVRPGARPSLYWHWSAKYSWHKNTPITGWNEALVAYVLAAGSVNHPIDPEIYERGWKNDGKYLNGQSYYGHRLPAGAPFGGPLFLSQYSFCTLDPRQLFDDDFDYWQQALAHTRINFEHCHRNPNGYAGYGQYGWGLTSSDGPDGYVASCPVNDYGVLAPTAALSSFPFLPDQAEAALRSFLSYQNGDLWRAFGFVDAFSPAQNWISDYHLAINQGPIVVMIENFRSGLLWKLFMSAPEVSRGLKRLGISQKLPAVPDGVYKI